MSEKTPQDYIEAMKKAAKGEEVPEELLPSAEADLDELREELTSDQETPREPVDDSTLRDARKHENFHKPRLQGEVYPDDEENGQ
jgi:hypothetical protein